MISLPWVAVFFACLFFNIMCEPVQAQAHRDKFTENDIYFSPETDLENLLISFMRNSVDKIDLAATDIRLEKIGDELIAAKRQRNVNVSVVVDKLVASGNPIIEKLSDYGIPVVESENPGGRMRMNFCVVDYRYTFFTSASLTYEDTHLDRNYACIVDSYDFANNFVVEFDEMFLARLFGQASLKNTPYPKIEAGGVKIDTFFLPEDNPNFLYRTILEGADSNILFYTNGLKNREVLSILKAEHLVNINEVQGIMDDEDSFAPTDGEFEELRRNGIWVEREQSGTAIRHSIFVVDDRTVLLFPRRRILDQASLDDEFFIAIEHGPVRDRFYNYIRARWNELTAGIAVTGVVRNAVTGDGLEGVYVDTSQADSNDYTDYLGWYEVRDLGAQRYLFSVQKSGYFGMEFFHDANDGIRKDIYLTPIEKWGTVAGYLLDKACRKPIAGAVVRATYTDPVTGVHTYITSTTNQDGYFVMKYLPVGTLTLEFTHPDFEKLRTGSFEVAADSFFEFQNAFLMNPLYLIAAYPNPVFEENIFINVRDNTKATRIPRLTVRQKNYLPVEVPLQIAATTSQYNLYTGNYRLIMGYWGTAEIVIDEGLAKKNFMIEFLQANDNKIPLTDGDGNLIVSGNNVKRAGAIALMPTGNSNERGVTIIPAGGRFEKATLELSIPPEYSCSNAGLYERSGDRVRLIALCRSGAKKISAQVEREGEYFIAVDRIPPEIRLINDGEEVAEFEVTDNLSGLDFSRLKVRYASGDLEITTKENRLFVRKPVKLMVAGAGVSDGENSGEGLLDRNLKITVTVSDRVGNGTARDFVLSPVAVKKGPAVLISDVICYPSPVRKAPLTIEVTGQDGLLKVNVFDSRGGIVARVVECQVAAGRNRFLWDLTGDSGKEIANGVYFIEAVLSKDGKSSRRIFKLAVLR